VHERVLQTPMRKCLNIFFLETIDLIYYDCCSLMFSGICDVDNLIWDMEDEIFSVYVMGAFVFNVLRWELIVCFVDIGGIVDHHKSLP
jgi:hypothetical protein